MSKIKEIFEKMRKIKHIQIILAVAVALLVCVIYFSFFTSTKSDKKDETSPTSFSSAEAYVDWLENKLDNVLSKISGAGQVSTIVTLQNGFTYDYAKEIETRTSTGGDVVITSETLILVNGEPVVVKEWFPVVQGVVIVSSGANDFSVKMKMLEAVQTVLEIKADNIKILS